MEVQIHTYTNQKHRHWIANGHFQAPVALPQGFYYLRGNKSVIYRSGLRKIIVLWVKTKYILHVHTDVP